MLIPLVYYASLTLTQNRWIIVFQTGLFFLPSAFVLKTLRIKNAFSKERFWQSMIFTLGITILATMVLNVCLKFWLGLFPPPEELQLEMKKILSLDRPYGLLLDLITVGLIPAICEEFFFRGFLQTGLSHHMHPKHAILAAAFFFALYHVNPWFLPFYFILGILFGWLYFRFNNLIVAIVAHLTNNAFGVVMYHLFGVG